MKNALILHGTAGTSGSNWFPWLKEELVRREWKVWVPDLPEAEHPSIERYNKFIFSAEYKFDTETVLIGHSSGAVAILGLLQALPKGTRVKEAILVGAFIDDLGRTDLQGLFQESFDFPAIRRRGRKFTLIHSDDDPYCPLPGAQKLAQLLEGKLIVEAGQKHFSVGTAGEKYKQFPLLLDLVTEDN